MYVIAMLLGLLRWGVFVTYDGEPVKMVGFDIQELHCDPQIDPIPVLDYLAKAGVNKVRIWTHCYWNREEFLHPWKYQDGKYDLMTWNDEYWARMKWMLRAAQKRGIIVEICLFNSNVLDSNRDWVLYSPWNMANNINGVFAGNWQGHYTPEFYVVDYPAMRYHQTRLIEKVVTETNEFRNVYYEVCNEFPGMDADVYQLYRWQLAIAAQLKSLSTKLVSVQAHQYVGEHTRGVELYGHDPNIDILTFHTHETDLDTLLAPADRYRKPIQNNEGWSLWIGEEEIEKEARRWVKRGNHYSVLLLNTRADIYWDRFFRVADILGRLRREK